MPSVRTITGLRHILDMFGWYSKFLENEAMKTIVFVRKVLKPVERNYSTTDREMLAIMFAIPKFRCYIEGCHFKIQTDHMALKFLQTAKEPAGRLGRWMLELQEYDLEIHYKKGSLQVEADTLSI